MSNDNVLIIAYLNWFRHSLAKIWSSAVEKDQLSLLGIISKADKAVDNELISYKEEDKKAAEAASKKSLEKIRETLEEPEKTVVDLLNFLRSSEFDLEVLGSDTRLEIHYKGGEELKLYVKGQGQYRSTTVSFKDMEKEPGKLNTSWMFMVNTVKHNLATHDPEGNEIPPPYFW